MTCVLALLYSRKNLRRQHIYTKCPVTLNTVYPGVKTRTPRGLLSKQTQSRQSVASLPGLHYLYRMGQDNSEVSDFRTFQAQVQRRYQRVARPEQHSHQTPFPSYLKAINCHTPELRQKIQPLTENSILADFKEICKKPHKST